MQFFLDGLVDADVFPIHTSSFSFRYEYCLRGMSVSYGASGWLGTSIFEISVYVVVLVFR